MKLSGDVVVSIMVGNEVVQEVSFKMPLEILNGEIEEISLYLANTEGIDKRKGTFSADPVDVLQMDLYKFLLNALDESPALQDIIRRKYRDENREPTPGQMDIVDRQMAKLHAKYHPSEADKLWGESYKDFIWPLCGDLSVVQNGGKP